MKIKKGYKWKSIEGMSKRTWAYEQRKKQANRYRKTLEDAERAVCDEMCDTLGCLCVYCDGKNSCITFKILDIISKAKEEK